MTEMSEASVQDTQAELRSQVRLARSVFVRRLYVAAGTIALGLGILGIVLPVMPTTPFLLLTAGCYARGSEKFYVWLLTNRFFGQYIRNWREKRGIPLWTKVWVIALLWLVLGLSAAFAVPLIPVKVLLIVIGAGVSLYIWRQPTLHRPPTLYPPQ